MSDKIKEKYIKYTPEKELETIHSHSLNGYTLDCEVTFTILVINLALYLLISLQKVWAMGQNQHSVSPYLLS